MKNSSILLNNVSVQYPINQPKKITEIFSRHPGHSTIQALSDINIRIHQGERVGLIGLNGAGKSTLLKVMAKIYLPMQGICQVVGKICPLFEFATGFEMDLNGWRNIHVRAMLLGMNKEEIQHKMHDIAAFTELGDFLNYPVRTYSSGMFIRLAFAISTAVNPEILLLDEVIGASDISFAKKAEQRIYQFIEKGHIMVLSTHSYFLLKQFCQRTIWLHKGNIQADGPTEVVWNEYSQFVNAT